MSAFLQNPYRFLVSTKSDNAVNFTKSGIKSKDLFSIIIFGFFAYPKKKILFPFFFTLALLLISAGAVAQEASARTQNRDKKNTGKIQSIEHVRATDSNDITEIKNISQDTLKAPYGISDDAIRKQDVPETEKIKTTPATLQTAGQTDRVINKADEVRRPVSRDKHVMNKADFLVDKRIIPGAGLTPEAFGKDNIRQDIPFFEDFTGVPDGDIPDDWSVDGSFVTGIWRTTYSDHAGGKVPELRGLDAGSSSITGQSWLISPKINTSGHDTLYLSFKNVIKKAFVQLRVYVRADGDLHIVEEWNSPGNVDEEEFLAELTADQGVGSEEFEIIWWFDGSSDNILCWIFDDVYLGKLYGLTVLEPIGEGTVTPKPGVYEYPANMDVALNALPHFGYTFDSWSQGNVEDPELPRTTINIGMNESQTVQATFPQYDLDNLWHQYDAGGSAATSAVDSEKGIDHEVADNFSFQSEEYIQKVVIHGLALNRFEPDSERKVFTGDDTRSEIPFFECFTGVEEGEIPDGWEIEGQVFVNHLWEVTDSEHAGGGEPPEMRALDLPPGWSIDGMSYLASSKINTSGYDTLYLSFKYAMSEVNVVLGVYTRVDGDMYLAGEWLAPGDVNDGEFVAELTAGDHGVGSEEFEIIWYFVGSSDDINWWVFDDVLLGEDPPFWTPGKTSPFIVRFYDEDSETEPDWGNPVSQQNVDGKMYPAGVVWGQEYQHYKVELDLDEPVELQSGWVSVQADVDGGAGGWFLLLEAETGDGDGQAWQRVNGDSEPIDFDIMAEIWGSTDLLPVELHSFTATCCEERQSVNIEWTTLSETNNSHFNIHRAYDDGNFEKIATIQGAGNSNSPVDYIYTDKPDNAADVIYYKLSQHDFDGKSETFSPVDVTCIKEIVHAGKLDLYPNPAKEIINITARSPANTGAVVEIYDINGVKVYEEKLRLNEGVNNSSVDVSGFTGGAYVVRVYSAAVAFSPQVIYVKR